MKFFKSKKRTRVERVLDRDQSVLVEVYQHIIFDIKRFVTGFSGTDEEADEALQQALVLMWEKVHQKKILLEVETYSFTREASKYLWCKRTENSIAMSEVDVDVVALIESDEAFFAPAYHNENFKLILDAFHSMSKISQKILTHVYWENMNYEKLSQVIKTSSAVFAKEKKESSLTALMEKVE